MNAEDLERLKLGTPIPEEEKGDIPQLDCTIRGQPVYFSQAFWDKVWKDVVKKMIEKDEKEKE